MASRVEEVSESLSALVEEIAGFISSIKDALSTCSSQCSHLEIAMQQLVDNHAARSDASHDVGDVRELLMQKSQLSVEAALWNKTSSRRHWQIRGRIPPNLAESPADLCTGLRGVVCQRHVTRGSPASVSATSTWPSSGLVRTFPSSTPL